MIQNNCKCYLLILLYCVSSSTGWQYFTSISQWKLENSAVQQREIHSEYFFGKCGKSNGYIYYTHIHLDHIEVLGKIIIRGWIDVPRIPGCIMVRGTSFFEYLFRNTAYNFQMCVPRITYCHSHTRFKYHYYEWYIPSDYIGGMNWDLYFYGPPVAFWH